MKICHITTVHSSFDNRIFYKECVFLSQVGYSVSLIAPGNEYKKVMGIELVPLKKRSKRVTRVLFTSFFEVLCKSLKNKADLYHFHDPEIMLAAVCLRIMGKKVVYDAHENLRAAILSKAYLPRVLRKMISLVVFVIEHLGSYFLSGIITARPDISDTFSREVCTLRNFPIKANLKVNESLEIIKNKFAVIYVGGMTKIRGIEELVDAFQFLDEAELWLVGSFQDQDLQDYCKNSNGWRNVRFFGQVKPNEVFGYINRADAGIITFYPEANHLKTLATKPFEYMACGLPMIMSNFRYWKDFFGEEALYVDPFNSREIADAVEKIIRNKDYYLTVGNRNYDLVMNEYNWEKEFQKLAKFYEMILEDNSFESIRRSRRKE